MTKKTLDRILMTSLAAASLIWLVMPFALAVLWSMVDPDYVWSHPDLFPKVLSFRRWALLWETTTLRQSMMNSYLLAITVALVTIVMALPTSFAFGRLDFRGKSLAQTIVLVPMVVPGFVIAIFFSSLLFSLGIYSKFLGILIGHTVILMPYALRILSVSFSQIRQDLIDAARDLGASRLAVFREVYFPAIKPGILASLIMIFIKSIEEFALSFIIGSPDFTTVPTILFSYLGYQFIRPNAAVISLILVVPNIILMLVMERVLKVQNPATIVGKG